MFPVVGIGIAVDLGVYSMVVPVIPFSEHAAPVSQTI
jgi:hypothetical protein